MRYAVRMMHGGNNGQDLGQRVRELRRRRRWSQRDLAQVAGVQNSTLARIESGETPNPKMRTLRALADAFGVGLEELTGQQPVRPRASITAGVAKIPVVAYHAHAGVGAIAAETGDHVYVDELLTRGRDLVAAIVTGDCLYPDVLPGETVVWDRSDHRPQDGQIVAIFADGVLQVKRAYYEVDGHLTLLDNQGHEVASDDVVLEGVVIQIMNVRMPERRPRPARR